MRCAFLLCIFLAGCASPVTNYTYKPRNTAIDSMQMLQAQLKTHLQYFSFDEDGELRVAVNPNFLEFGKTSFQLRGEKIRKVSHVGPVKLPASIVIDYADIQSIRLVEKRNIYRAVILNASGDELLLATSASKEDMWLFIDTLISYGGLTPNVVNRPLSKSTKKHS